MTRAAAGAGPAQHWDAACTDRDPEQVSWYQSSPQSSLRLLDAQPGSVLDVGAGASTLVDALLAAGRTDLTLPHAPLPGSRS